MTEITKVEGKTFLITGAASGLGAGYVVALLKEGAERIAVLDIAEEKGKELANQLNKSYPGKVLFIKCDIGHEENIADAYNEVVNKFGTIDVVINNAGILNDSLDMWRKACNVNYAGTVSLTFKAIRHMRTDKGGKGGTIINVSSTLGLIKEPNMPCYAGTKIAVLHFSQGLAMDPLYSNTGVRILTICFGPTDTPLLYNLRQIGYDEYSCEKLGAIDGHVPYQKPQSAIKGVVDMFKQGTNGSVWLCINDKPGQDITPVINSAYDIINQLKIY